MFPVRLCIVGCTPLTLCLEFCGDDPANRCPYLSGRLEETEEELVQLKIEREADRQRRAKYGTANGAAVEAITSGTAEPPGEGGGEVWGAGEDGETSKAPTGELTTSQGKLHNLFVC